MNLMTDAAGNSNIPDALNALASGDIATAGMILEMLGGILFAALVFYLIGAMARYKYLRIRSYQGAWLAFIPYASNWAVVEATYGPKLNINVYGIWVPAVFIKLWPVLMAIFSGFANAMLPSLDKVFSMIFLVLNMAVLVMIYKDIMERLKRPQKGFFPVIAVFISMISSICILMAASKFDPGDQDYTNDKDDLQSQSSDSGTLSGMINKVSKNQN